MNDAEAALPLFRNAVVISTDNITEVVTGLGQCISETDSPEAALAFLKENATLPINSTELGELKAELESDITP